jgi:arginase family enzyme
VPAEDVDAAVEHLRKQARHLYVRLDLGSLDPAVVRRSWTHHCQAGSSRQQLDRMLTGIRERFAVDAATIATYTPAKDPGTTPPVDIDAIVHVVAAHTAGPA